MGDSASAVQETLRSFLDRMGKATTFAPETKLYADGLGLDSLQTAELSAVLEDDFGTDPFSGDAMPQTVGDILDFYGAAVAEA